MWHGCGMHANLEGGGGGGVTMPSNCHMAVTCDMFANSAAGDLQLWHRAMLARNGHLAWRQEQEGCK